MLNCQSHKLNVYLTVKVKCFHDLFTIHKVWDNLPWFLIISEINLSWVLTLSPDFFVFANLAFKFKFVVHNKRCYFCLFFPSINAWMVCIVLFLSFLCFLPQFFLTVFGITLALQCFLGKTGQNSMVLLKMTINSYTFFSQVGEHLCINHISYSPTKNGSFMQFSLLVTLLTCFIFFAALWASVWSFFLFINAPGWGAPHVWKKKMR